MSAEFQAIMHAVLQAKGLRQEVRALIRLGTFVIAHYDLLLGWMIDHDRNGGKCEGK